MEPLCATPQTSFRALRQPAADGAVACNAAEPRHRPCGPPISAGPESSL